MTKYVVTEYGVKNDGSLLQTQVVQDVLDKCKESGGQVVFPEGEYLVSGLYVHSNTEIVLEENAKIYGSINCNDYKVFDVPNGIQIYCDYSLLLNYRSFPDVQKRGNTYRQEYRRAIFTSYGEKNISFIGKAGSLIDGQDCFDENGDEGFRGPHCIWMSSCDTITFKGINVFRAASFAWQIDGCKNILFEDVTIRAGHDGVHCHLCHNILLYNCRIETGDDSIAGANVENMIIDNCYLNSSCSIFRLGGRNIIVKNTRLQGFGKYVHRYSIVKSRDEILPEEDGRRNTFFVFQFFGVESFSDFVAENIVFSNCEIDNVDGFLFYLSDSQENLHTGAPLKEIRLENVKITRLLGPSVVKANKKYPLRIILNNVTVDGEDIKDSELFAGKDKNTIIIYE